MKYTHTDYEAFLKIELETQVREYEQIVQTRAIVLKERGEIFVGRFVKIQNNGMAIFKVRKSDNMPRKNSFWTATYLIGEMGSFKNWGNNTWTELRNNYQRIFSEALCVWIQKSDENDFCIIGIKGLSLEFVRLLEEEKPIIAFGPKDPPLQYLVNLIELVKNNSCIEAKEILDYDETEKKWNPEKIEESQDFTSILMNDMQSNNCIAVQGPPGTGKTYRMAQLAARLLSENKSVLVTALTNQALMELAKKEDLKPFLEKGKVSKTSLTVDEVRELSKLLPITDNKCNASPGNLSLATFYVASGWANSCSNKPFDYVIMDEASQALLPMIAAARKLGNKTILIGDQNQLAPIVLTNEDIINAKNWSAIVRGFETICNNFSFKSYMLCDTFRLTNRGAECTGIFYNNNLKSVSSTQLIPSNIQQLNKKGGPIFLGIDLKIGVKSPKEAFDSTLNLVQQIIEENPKAEIAILSKFRETVREMQRYFVLNWNITKALPDNIKIETVDRVQGLTVDYCFFVIPNASHRYSLENELFNVATSRAKYNTIIVSDKSLLGQNMSEEVRKYLLKAQEEKFVSFEPKTISAGNISVFVKGKIDISQFERKKPTDYNGYTFIIDTNVFVKSPDIIAKIGGKNKTIVPATVLEELDKLKLKSNIDKKSLNSAARNINTAFAKDFSHMEDADVSLLPTGFDPKNPDCRILSVALKHKGENTILLTSDNMLLSRASGLGIRAMSLSEFQKS